MEDASERIRRELHELVWLRKSTCTDRTMHTLDDRLHRYCYGRLGTNKPANGTKTYPSYPHGSVFNVEFTPAGSAVLAVHARRAITVHDAHREAQVLSVPQAHINCVNVLTFLDEHTFVTGSDDQTIKVWDLRKLPVCVATLEGHTGWIKNVEYDKLSGRLFSTAFDDGVRTWNMARMSMYKRAEDADNLLFAMKDGMRMRLSPDGCTMVIAERYSHLVTISNFDGATIGSLWDNFPHDFPPSETDKQRLTEYSLNHSTNLASIQTIGKVSEGNVSYRSLLSLAFHPSSNFLAARAIDVRDMSLLSDMCLLYDFKLKGLPKKVSYAKEDLSSCFLKYHEQDSYDSVMGYIKEISFSSDGRILVTPHLNGVQLLATDSCCTNMDLFYDDRYSTKEKLGTASLEFKEVGFCTGHEDGVLTCKLNSSTMTLVSGCVEGRVIFNTPRL